MYIRLRRLPNASRWLLFACVLLVLFLIYTAIFSTGVFLNLTLRQEQWLLHRPLTSVDCVLYEWKNFGEAPFSLFFTLLLGLGCVALGYRRRVLPCLLLIAVLGVGSEALGKQVFSQPVPYSLGFGMASLDCPQIQNKPPSMQLMVTAGMWWEAPPISPRRILNARYSAATPFTVQEASPDNGYPSGHAIRWSFLGLVLCWLVWGHIKRRLLRWPLMALAIMLAIGGGAAQFYIGVHLTTDVVAGYLLGASSACFAISFLLRNSSDVKIYQPPDQNSHIFVTYP
jgi:membrane-associated phospholipid phosphatase